MLASKMADGNGAWGTGMTCAGRMVFFRERERQHSFTLLPMPLTAYPAGLLQAANNRINKKDSRYFIAIEYRSKLNGL